MLFFLRADSSLPLCQGNPMPKPAHLERHYSQDEVADLIGVHVITIKRACKRRELTFYKVGRSVRIPQSAIDEWLASQEVRASQANAARSPVAPRP